MSERILARKSVSVSGKAEVKKPSKDYPLVIHKGANQWSKKIRGKTYYFGVLSDPQAALNKWLEQKDALLAGRDPDERLNQPDLKWLVDTFLDGKQQLVNQGELAKRTLENYHDACKRLVAYFGKQRLVASLGPKDFAAYRAAFPKTWGSLRINDEVARVSAVMRYAYDFGAVDVPVRTGPNFKRVSKKQQRIERASKNTKFFSAEEIHSVLANADVQMRAMILLGINAGYGNADCGRLMKEMIDFDKQWLSGLRQKTGIEREAWLWPETMTAINAALESRYHPDNATHESLVFITKYRGPWHKEGVKGDPVSAQYRKLMKKAGCYRHGVGFYSLRHVFETIGGGAKDQVALNHVMGHADQHVSAAYREGIDPERVKAVCRHVRDWFIAAKDDGGEA